MKMKTWSDEIIDWWSVGITGIKSLLHYCSPVKAIFWLVLCALLFTLLASANAQQPRVPRIVLLGGGSAVVNAGRIEAFRQGLRDLGYTEGKNIVIEERWTNGKIDRLIALTRELTQLNADVIVSAGPTVTRALKDAKVTIPIVM